MSGFLVVGGFILSIVLVVAGIVFVLLGVAGDVQISFLGQTVKTTSPGVGVIFLGAVLAALIIRRGLKSLEASGQRDSSTREVVRTILVGAPLRYNRTDHFYTTSRDERARAISVRGYRDEGICGYVFTSQSTETVPLYRLWNSSTGDHLYTISDTERHSAIARSGYRDEGVACYVFAKQVKGTTPLHRLWLRAQRDHFYTLSKAERDKAIAEFNYRSEGVACYIYPDHRPTTVPFYRLYRVA